MSKKQYNGVDEALSLNPTSFEYKASTSSVSRAWEAISYTQGVLLTQVEAVLGEDSRTKPFKDLIKREVQRMGFRIQDTIYEEYNIQQRKNQLNGGEPVIDAEE